MFLNQLIYYVFYFQYFFHIFTSHDFLEIWKTFFKEGRYFVASAQYTRVLLPEELFSSDFLIVKRMELNTIATSRVNLSTGSNSSVSNRGPRNK